MDTSAFETITRNDNIINMMPLNYHLKIQIIQSLINSGPFLKSLYEHKLKDQFIN